MDNKDDSPFACTACTYVNEEGGLACEICETPRPVAEPEAGPVAKPSANALAPCLHDAAIPCERKSVFCSRTGRLNILRGLAGHQSMAQAFGQLSVSQQSPAPTSTNVLIANVIKVIAQLASSAGSSTQQSCGVAGSEYKESASEMASYTNSQFIEIVTSATGVPTISASGDDITVTLPTKEAITSLLKVGVPARRPLVAVMDVSGIAAYLIIFPSGYSYLVDPCLCLSAIGVVESAISAHITGLRADGMLNGVRHIPQSAWNREGLGAVGRRPKEQHNAIGLMAIALIIECKMSPIDALRHVRGLLASEMNVALGRVAGSVARTQA